MTSADFIKQKTYMNIHHRDTYMKFHRVIKQNTRNLKPPSPQKGHMLVNAPFTINNYYSHSPSKILPFESKVVYWNPNYRTF